MDEQTEGEMGGRTNRGTKKQTVFWFGKLVIMKNMHENYGTWLWIEMPNGWLIVIGKLYKNIRKWSEIWLFIGWSSNIAWKCNLLSCVFFIRLFTLIRFLSVTSIASFSSWQAITRAGLSGRKWCWGFCSISSSCLMPDMSALIRWSSVGSRKLMSRSRNRTKLNS